MSERIIAAAVMFDGVCCVLPPPARHHTILHAIHDLRPNLTIGPDEQGFVTDRGRFVDRTEAKELALIAGQMILPRAHKHLFSEDLW